MNNQNSSYEKMKFKNGLTTKLPILCGDIGAKYFIFSEGTKTKTFYNCLELIDNDSPNAGFYPILNEQGEIIAYLSLLGKFSKAPTKVGNAYYNYLKNEPICPYIQEKSGLGYKYTPYFGTEKISFTLFANKTFRDAVQVEEERRVEMFRDNDMFFNNISYLTYKFNASRNITNKVAKFYANKRIVDEKKRIASMPEGKAKRKAIEGLHKVEYFFNKDNLNGLTDNNF